MKECASCKESIQQSLNNHSFAFCHLYNNEKPMNMHIHNCYEIYYSISGGKQFLIDDHLYDIEDGDIFIINQFESHYLFQIDQQKHERIILSIDPNCVKKLSTENTNLQNCFENRESNFPHRLRLSTDEQTRFLYLIRKLRANTGYGADILDQSIFMELLVFLNSLFMEKNSACTQEKKLASSHHTQVDDILLYINNHIREELSLKELSDHFYLSPSYICRIFKMNTGTTIKKYIIAKRIAISKSLLTQGYSINEACDACGFSDYSNYFKAFTKAVGVSPKKYAQLNS